MALVMTAAIAALASFTASAGASLPAATTFNFTDAEQSYPVPAGVTMLRIEAVGGEGQVGGSGGGAMTGGSGGFGADVLADVPATPGTTLYVEVGGNGVGIAATFNGGGMGGLTTTSGSAGGGASDVRTCSRTGTPSCPAGTDTLTSRIVVAGGGGGGGGGGATATGGAGGSAAAAGHNSSTGVGCIGAAGGGGGAGTASSGGAGGFGACADVAATGQDGGYGSGGTGGSPNPSGGGGGGGGWFGGGGGGGSSGSSAAAGGGGGGGSNFVTSSAGNISVNPDTTGSPTIVITPIQGQPSATTQAASAPSATGATLNATVNPDGVATTYRFEYGTTTAYGAVTPSTSAGSGTSDQPESAMASGLDPNTTYHFRIVATSSAGTANGADQTFTTQPAPPEATTGPAGDVTDSSATLNGTVDPQNSATTFHFEYGTTASYGSSTATQPAGSDSADHQLSQSLTGLAAGTTYHFRIVADNPGGTTDGADQTFTTQAAPAAPSAPAVSTGSATSLQPTGATLTGALNPNGRLTSYHFDYGTSAGYGASTATQSGGSGGSLQGVSAALSQLKPNTTYHYRLVASSSAGSSSGGDQTFTTPKPAFSGASAPVQTDTLSRKGDIAVRVACPAGTYRSCAGTVRLTLFIPGRPAGAGAAFSIASGKRTSVTIHASRKTRAGIGRARRVVVLAVVASHDAAGTRNQTFTVIAVSAPPLRRGRR